MLLKWTKESGRRGSDYDGANLFTCARRGSSPSLAFAVCSRDVPAARVTNTTAHTSRSNHPTGISFTAKAMEYSDRNASSTAIQVLQTATRVEQTGVRPAAAARPGRHTPAGFQVAALRAVRSRVIWVSTIATGARRTDASRALLALSTPIDRHRVRRMSTAGVLFGYHPSPSPHARRVRSTDSTETVGELTRATRHAARGSMQTPRVPVAPCRLHRAVRSSTLATATTL